MINWRRLENWALTQLLIKFGHLGLFGGCLIKLIKV